MTTNGQDQVCICGIIYTTQSIGLIVVVIRRIEAFVNVCLKLKKSICSDLTDLEIVGSMQKLIELMEKHEEILLTMK